MINLMLAGVWLVTGVGALLWAMLDPERNARMQGVNLYFVGGGALALALYNAVRWWFTRPGKEFDWLGRPFPPRKPPRVVDYNPDLDFTKRDPDEKPPV